MGDAVRRVVTSELLTAVSRMLILIGTPVMISLLTWFTGSFVNLQQTVALLMAEQTRIVQDVKELQGFRADMTARGAASSSELAAIREILMAQQRALTRIEAQIDRQKP